MKLNKVTVQKLERPIHDGDEHDKPLKWAAIGPDKEQQNFPTKRDADLYASFRRRKDNQKSATNMYLLATLAGF